MKHLISLKQLIIGIIDWFYKPFQNKIPIETFRYAVCGGGNTVLDILLYFITYNFILNKNPINLEVIVISPHIAAFLFVFPITFSTGFLLSKYITFTESQLGGRTQLFRYGLSVFGAIVLNYLFLKLFVDYCGIYPTPSKIITTFFLIIYSYIMQRNFTFKYIN